MFRSIIAALLLTFSATAAPKPSIIDYLQLGYGNLDFDDVNVDGSGLGIGGVVCRSRRLARVRKLSGCGPQSWH